MCVGLSSVNFHIHERRKIKGLLVGEIGRKTEEELFILHLQGMEDPTFINQYEMDAIDQINTQDIAAALGEDFHHSLSSESYSSYPSFSCSSMDASHTRVEESAKQQLRPNSWNSNTAEAASNIFSFCNPNSPSNPQQYYGNIANDRSFGMKDKTVASKTSTKTYDDNLIISQGSFMNQSCVTKAEQGSVRMSVASTKPPPHTQDHIIAERKRRQKLSQQFMALSTIVPGLKKMDKASVLGDAIKYMKQLQERVKTLEEQVTKKTMESAVSVKKSLLSVDDDLSSSDENFDGQCNEPLPEIEARISDKNVLIRIHCEKHKGTLVKILEEIETLHLSVVNTSMMPFADSTLDITVIAQMEEDFSMTLKDLVKNLHRSLSKSM